MMKVVTQTMPERLFFITAASILGIRQRCFDVNCIREVAFRGIKIEVFQVSCLAVTEVEVS